MRKVILQEFVSIDGLASGIDGGVAFVSKATTGDKEFGKRQEAFLDSVDTILLGRKTYELFSGYWPGVTSGEEKSIADRLNATPKVVFSNTLDRAPWGTWADARIVTATPSREVERLKEEDGRNMVVWGSISLAHQLMHENVIDEYQLVVCPVVLVEGRRLFDEHVQPTEFTLTDTESFDRSTVLLTYSA